MGRKRKRKRSKGLGASPAPAAGSRPVDGGRAGTAPGSEKGTKTQKRQRTTFDVCRDNIEALVIAIILAIIIRHFAVEAFEIPTGSMAPTLYGIHVWQECPNCSTKYNLAIRSNSSTGEIDIPFDERRVYRGRCGNEKCTLSLHARDPDGRSVSRRSSRVKCQGCGTAFQGKSDGFQVRRAYEASVRCPICHHHYSAVIEKSELTGGHKILVNKFAYSLAEPKRWDVIVFEFDQWKNYIKRLIGRPGENIRIFDGDIYVDGKIERKSKRPLVQDAMWRKISDSDVPERGLNKTPAWRELGAVGTGSWTEVHKPRRGQRWALNNHGSQEVSVLEYARNFDNYVSYNVLSRETTGSGGVEVGDRKVAFTAHPLSAGKHGWLGVEIRDGDYSFQLRLPVGTPSESFPAILERLINEPDPNHPDPSRPAHKRTLKDQRVLALPLNESSRIEMENVDDRVAVRIEGEEVLRFEYTSCPDLDHPPTPNGKLAQNLRILGADVRAEVESIQVYQDFYYIRDMRPGGRWTGIELEEGQYLALGDNSASSSDGRVWGFVPEKNLMGKAILVFWPAWPTKTGFQCKIIR